MSHSTKGLLPLFALVLLFLSAAVGLRVVQDPAPDWVPLFDVGALLSLAALSVAWERGAARDRAP